MLTPALFCILSLDWDIGAFALGTYPDNVLLISIAYKTACALDPYSCHMAVPETCSALAPGTHRNIVPKIIFLSHY